MEKKILDKLRNAGEEVGELVWLPEYEIGYYPVKDTQAPYDKAYFDKYVKYDEASHAINEARLDLTKQFTHTGDVIIDIGIGCGAFVRDMQDDPHVSTYGFDINPAGVDWLNQQKRFLDASRAQVDVMTFFDSLEHIKEPDKILSNIMRTAIVAAPIYTDVKHLLRSKHFRKDEHCWYFTWVGTINFMKAHGFDFVYSDKREEKCGREDITSFVFSRPTSAGQTLPG